jgi:hypothetical protein
VFSARREECRYSIAKPKPIYDKITRAEDWRERDLLSFSPLSLFTARK